MDLNTLRDEIYSDALAHGLWEDLDALAVQSRYLDLVRRRRCAMMIEAEAREAWDAAHNTSHFAEEIADVIIMALSTCGYLEIDIEAQVRAKMAANKGRPWKHGKDGSHGHKNV